MAKDQAGVVPADFERLRLENDALRRKLDGVNVGFKPGEAEGIGATEEPGGGIALGEALLFAEGQASIKPEGLKVLGSLVTLLKTEYPHDKLIVEGHTDNQPLDKTRERWRYNMILAWNRASAVFEYLVQHGIPEANIKCESYGPNKPLNPATASSAEGRRQNRRVVVRRGGEAF
jgi:chemotaxis protein MotB